MTTRDITNFAGASIPTRVTITLMIAEDLAASARIVMAAHALPVPLLADHYARSGTATRMHLARIHVQLIARAGAGLSRGYNGAAGRLGVEGGL